MAATLEAEAQILRKEGFLRNEKWRAILANSNPKKKLTPMPSKAKKATNQEAITKQELLSQLFSQFETLKAVNLVFRTRSRLPMIA